MRRSYAFQLAPTPCPDDRAEGKQGDSTNDSAHHPGEVLSALLDHGAKFGAVVEVREGGILRDRYAKELAQWFPSLFDIIDEETIGGYQTHDFLVVPVEGVDGILAVFKAPVEGALPHEGVDHAGHFTKAREEYTHCLHDACAAFRCVDGGTSAVIPFFWVAHAEEDFGFGVLVHQFAVEGASWPIDGCAVSREEGFPIDGATFECVDPDACVVRVREYFAHVVAAIKAKLFECGLE